MKITIEMRLITCHCGTVYAIPDWLHHSSYACPLCARRTIRGLDIDYEELSERMEKLERSNAALRGTITRMKNKTTPMNRSKT